MKSIQSPEGVTLLMENLWLRHIAGMKRHPCNVYIVELPPLTEEEQRECERNRAERAKQPPLDLEDMQRRLQAAICKLQGM